MCFVRCREIEYLKKETAQRRAQKENEATHKEEADNLQEKVSEILTLTPLVSSGKSSVSVRQPQKTPRFPILVVLY